MNRANTTGADTAWNHMIQSMIPPDVQLLAKAPVDGKIWHTVKLSWPAADWIQTQDSNKWQRLVGNIAGAALFDIEESLVTALMLKYN